jgi:hypothetical protein
MAEIDVRAVLPAVRVPPLAGPSGWPTHPMLTKLQVAPFVLATLLGAFLLFQVQPVITKKILPWFGGSPAVWTTCVLFFQLVLLGGYAYAHWLIHQARPRH